MAHSKHVEPVGDQTSPEVRAILKRHGAKIVSLTPSVMKIRLDEYSTGAADQVYNQLRLKARVSSMVSIVVVLP